jgi:hypothetical protein
MTLVAVVAAFVVSVIFTRRLFRRWARDGRSNPGLLAWGIALGLFGVTMAALLVGVAAGWPAPVFHVHYLAGAVLAVPWLALGVVLTNAGDRWTTRLIGIMAGVAGAAFLPAVVAGNLAALVGVVLGAGLGAVLWFADEERVRVGAFVGLVGFSVVGAGIILLAPLEAALPSTGMPDEAVLGLLARGLARGATVVGALVVIVGALAASGRLAWTALAAERDGGAVLAGHDPVSVARTLLDGWGAVVRARLDHVVRGNLLIVLGVLVALGAAGGIAWMGAATSYAVGVAIGVPLLYAGFERATLPSSARVIPGPVPPPPVS